MDGWAPGMDPRSERGVGIALALQTPLAPSLLGPLQFTGQESSDPGSQLSFTQAPSWKRDTIMQGSEA